MILPAITGTDIGLGEGEPTIIFGQTVAPEVTLGITAPAPSR